MADYFLMQMLYSSLSPVRPISDIFSNIGCSSTLHVYRVCVYTAVYHLAYQRQVNVIAMSNHSKVFLQLIVITLLGDKKYLTKHSECAYH